jgi:hypothetical protein
MARKLRFGLGGLFCGAIWCWGVWRFVEGDSSLGTVLIFAGGLLAAALIGLYNRDPTQSASGVIEAALEFLHLH